MKFEQESNPSAAVAAPPFNKGGKGLAPELAETAAANVPLAKGGWPRAKGILRVARKSCLKYSYTAV